MSWYKNPVTWYAILSGLAGIVGVLAKVHPTTAWLGIVNGVLTWVLSQMTEQGIVSSVKAKYGLK